MQKSEQDYPELNQRAVGWLNFLYQKATTPDNWTEDGDPHEWWDRSSTPPMCSFPRFDLQESTYALGLWQIELQLGEKFMEKYLMRLLNDP